jgi:hypothetical protein
MPDFSILLSENDLWMHSRTVGSRYGNKNVENLAKKIGHTFWMKEETSKFRYLYFLCGKKEKKRLISDLKIPILPYSQLTHPTQLVRKVYVENGQLKKVEILQGDDIGWKVKRQE